jgi:hypothetical protein
MIPIPIDDFDEMKSEITIEVKDDDWYREFFNVKPWKCACGLTNFGRNLSCASCRMEKNK